MMVARANDTTAGVGGINMTGSVSINDATEPIGDSSMEEVVSDMEKAISDNGMDGAISNS